MIHHANGECRLDHAIMKIQKDILKTIKSAKRSAAEKIRSLIIQFGYPEKTEREEKLQLTQRLMAV